jgi:hypothetical protein
MIARYLLALQQFRGNQHVIHCRAKCRYFATSRYHPRLTQLPTLRSDPSFAFVVSPQYKSTAILETVGETEGAIGTSRAFDPSITRYYTQKRCQALFSLITHIKDFVIV